MNEIQDKIEQIVIMAKIWSVGELHKQLNTLLQKSNKEAVEGFVEFICDDMDTWIPDVYSHSPIIIDDMYDYLEKYLKTLNGTAKPNDTTVLEELKKSAEEHNKNNGKYKLPEGAIPMENTTEHDKKIAEEAVRGFAYKYFDFAKTDDGQGGIAVYSTKVEFFMFLDRFLAEKESFEKFESKQNETPLPDLLDFLSEPIKYKDVYYYLQVSKTRCWYQDLEGNKLEFKDADGSWTEFVKDGSNLVDSLGHMRNYLFAEWIAPTWKQEDGFKAVLQEETYLSSRGDKGEI